MSKGKSARKSAPGKPFAKGGDPRQGRGPKPGHGGRPPDEFRDFMRNLVNRKAATDFLTKCVDGEYGPKFHVAAMQYATDRAYGKAQQSVEHSGRVDGGVLMVPAPIDAAGWAAEAARQQAGMSPETEEGES